MALRCSVGSSSFASEGIAGRHRFNTCRDTAHIFKEGCPAAFKSKIIIPDSGSRTWPFCSTISSQVPQTEAAIVVRLRQTLTSPDQRKGTKVSVGHTPITDKTTRANNISTSFLMLRESEALESDRRHELINDRSHFV